MNDGLKMTDEQVVSFVLRSALVSHRDHLAKLLAGFDDWTPPNLVEHIREEHWMCCELLAKAPAIETFAAEVVAQRDKGGSENGTS